MARAPQARQQQTAQVLGSPLARRSQYLAKALEAMRQEPERIAGYGDLAARLAAQALTQAAASRTDKALEAEASNAALARQQSIFGPLGVEVPGEMQEVGSGRLGNPFSGIGRMFGRGESAPAQVSPTPDMPPEPPTQQTAPVAPVQNGGALPPVGMMPQDPVLAQPAGPQAMPQAQPARPDPFAMTPQERAFIEQAFMSGDPTLIAQAEELAVNIRTRGIGPAAERYEIQDVNGVKYLIDPATGQSQQVFTDGVPEPARSTQFLAGPDNSFGVPSGTLLQRSPEGVVSVVAQPAQGYERVPGAGLRPERGGPADPTVGGARITTERQLREDYRRDTAGYREARQGYEKVRAAAADATGASDVALIFGYMKILDPTSVVREGEFATAQNTASVPERIQGLYNRALQGDRLTPAQRAEFVRSAESQFQTYDQGYQETTQLYRGLAQDYGLSPDNVIGAQRAPQPRQTQRQQPRPSQPPRPQQAPQRQGAEPRRNRRRYNVNTGQFE